MRKEIIILGVTILIVTVALFVTLFYGVQSLQFAGGGINQVTATGIDLTLLTCNPSFVPQSIEEIDADLNDKSGNIGSLTVGNITPSGSQAKMDATLTFTDFESMKTFVGWILNNTNPSDFQATVLVKTKILNLIPYSYEKSYDFAEFDGILFDNKDWGCKSKQGFVQASDIQGQLMSAQSRFSASELLYSGKSILEGNSTKTENQSNAENATQP